MGRKKSPPKRINELDKTEFDLLCEGDTSRALFRGYIPLGRAILMTEEDFIDGWLGG